MPKTQPRTLQISVIENTQGCSLHRLFEKVESSPWSILYDTSDSTESNGRFNIMVWDPISTITARNGITTVTDKKSGEQTQWADPPLELVKQQHQKLIADVSLPTESGSLASQLPFLIGAAGLLSYDLGRYYESIPATAEDQYLCPDMAVGIYQRALIEDAHTGTLYDCRLDSEPAFCVESWIQNTTPNAGHFQLTANWQSNFDKCAYLAALDKIHQYLKAGDAYQVNLAQRFTATYEGSEWHAYTRLQAANKAPFSAFMRLEKSCIMSISPERFLAVRDGYVETKPIKGTRPRYADPSMDSQSAQELLNSEKDRAENLMIVDLLRNDLSKHCRPHSVKVPNLFEVESYAAVHHLVSTVVGELGANESPLDLIAGAFPGGSITGAPKVRAMEIIEELEPHRRSLYCGSMMYLGFKNDMDSSICIRSLLAERGQLHCWAGGGIVLDSQPDSEYQETFDKVARILPVLEGTFE
ncbi:aminodeoxychorismate synthase component I [Alteromonas aestuariivivens]|uniref:aminodeoxychorismate synthase n=1 Tax=Alteromonas aestuariivivens TaxID=1938339 RepID=A0A3D8M8Q6_9ALTE|nr:aminodeoxychorismate synthase component I [Alteromonas aestuariivivens]RDV25996.1 aminodeoxychorismate synthase component I [Alteromonas aestuariivivens]